MTELNPEVLEQVRRLERENAALQRDTMQEVLKNLRRNVAIWRVSRPYSKTSITMLCNQRSSQTRTQHKRNASGSKRIKAALNAAGLMPSCNWSGQAQKSVSTCEAVRSSTSLRICWGGRTTESRRAKPTWLISRSTPWKCLKRRPH